MIHSQLIAALQTAEREWGCSGTSFGPGCNSDLACWEYLLQLIMNVAVNKCKKKKKGGLLSQVLRGKAGPKMFWMTVFTVEGNSEGHLLKLLCFLHSEK